MGSVQLFVDHSSMLHSIMIHVTEITSYIN